MKSLFRRTETWVMFALGFSAGLPILLVYSTLSTWLHEAGINLKVIGWFSLVGLAYGFFLFLVAIDVSPLYQALLMLGLLFGIALAGPCSIAIARKCCKI